jgi:hypothetical protein
MAARLKSLIEILEFQSAIRQRQTKRTLVLKGCHMCPNLLHENRNNRR